MVRDDASPGAAFLFVGSDGAGQTVVRYRQRAGEPSSTIPFGPTGVNRWFRLVVGTDTVYAFDAAPVSTGLAGAWNFLAAVSVELAGGGPGQRRADLGGIFVARGAADFTDLHQTEHLLWSERTVLSGSAAQSPAEGWTPTPPAAGQIARSPVLLSREGDGSPGHVDFPIQARAAGTYRFYLHLPAGNPGSVSAALVIGGVPQTPVVLDNQPPGRSSWLLVGSATLGANGWATLRLLHPGTPGLLLQADAARAVLVPKAESAASADYLFWTKLPSGTNRISLLHHGQPNNEVRRTAHQTNGWNGAAVAQLALVGDGKAWFRIVGPGRRLQAGLSTVGSGLDPSTIEHRFFSTPAGTVLVPNTAVAAFPQNNGEWLEIERVGAAVFHRRWNLQNGTLVPTHLHLAPAAGHTPEKTYPTLWMRMSAWDADARLVSTFAVGDWAAPSAIDDLDGDGASDIVERWVIDADPEDGIQSIHDVDMNADPDGDGLTNQQEYDLNPQTNPTKADTDGDGLSDGEEVNLHGTAPTNPDTDGDGLSDGEEVNSPLGFNPLQWSTLVNGVSNGVSDRVRWDIIHDDPTHYTTLASILPSDDYDGDGVSNLHEGEDGTSAIDIEDYFQEVAFDRLFGSHVGSSATVDVDDGVESSRLLRTAAVPAPAAGISHHEAGDGTRVRFQFLPLNPASGTGDQVIVGFAHRGHPSYGAIPEAHYAVAIRRETDGKARLLFYGGEADAAPVFEVSDSDLVELRLATGPDGAAPRTLQVEVNQSAVFPDPIPLPAGPGGFDGFTWDHDKKESTAEVPEPLALVVHLPGDGAGVHNLRYRRVHDPDRDNDQLPDRWEQQILDAYPLFGDVAAVLPGGHADDDDLTNLEEYQLGTDPTNPDTDFDGMGDGWEDTYGLDPLDPSDAEIDPADPGSGDLDGDGLSNLAEHDFGSRPDLASTAEDGFSDFWKHRWGLDPGTVVDPGGDPDLDGLTNAEEFALGTNPHHNDSDGDGFLDGWEEENGFDPLHDDRLVDSDGDRLLNTDELAIGTDPVDPDSDDDGLADGDEVHIHLTQPTNPDSDGDGLPDGWEVAGLIMHFAYESLPANPVEPGVNYGLWSLDFVDELAGGDETRTIYRHVWTRIRGVYDWRSGHTETLTETLERVVTVHSGGFVEEPADGWHHDTAAGTLVEVASIPTWTVHYDEALRLWRGVHQTATHRSTWWWVLTDPLSGDTDCDGLPDRWEYDHWLHPDQAADAVENPDNDLVDNTGEYAAGTHPWRADTDGDALSDGHEITVTFSDPLDPLDPGSAGGAVVPASPVRTVAKRTEFLAVAAGGSAPGTGTGSDAPSSRAPTLSGQGGPPLAGPPPVPHPAGGPLPAAPGAPAPDRPKAPPEEELYLEWRVLEKALRGGDSLPGGPFPDPDGDDDLDGIRNGDDDDWAPAFGVESPDPEPYQASIRYTAGETEVEELSEESIDPQPAVDWANRADIASDTDWEKTPPKPLAGATLAAKGFPAYAEEIEARLVRRTDPSNGESYAPVEVEVKRTFLKITRSRQILQSGGKGEWTVNSTEKVELTIPAGKSKSTEDGQTPLPVGVLEGDLTGGAEVEVRLLPVDIDIIHPATGELEESEEDYSGSGPRKGGLVALKRDETTPLTKLHLKAIDSLPTGSKSRLKVETPSGSGSINIYEDHQQTQLVTPGQTEFYAKVERKLYLEAASVSKTSSITVTQQINIGGNWIDGDAVSLTVVHAEIPVVMRAFIPHAWTEGEWPVPVGLEYVTNPLDPYPIPVLVPIFSDCVGGNRQDFSVESFNDEDEYKLRQEVIITPYRELHGDIDLVSRRRTGTTPLSKFYKKSEDVPESDQDARFGESFVPGATANWEFGPVEPVATYEEFERVQNSNGNDVTKMTPSLSGDAGHPDIVPEWSLPNIDFQFKIKAERVEDDGVAKIYFTTEAKHNLYPAFELTVADSDEIYSHVYQYAPAEDILPGPISLNSFYEGPGIRKRVQ